MTGCLNLQIRPIFNEINGSPWGLGSIFIHDVPTRSIARLLGSLSRQEKGKREFIQEPKLRPSTFSQDFRLFVAPRVGGAKQSESKQQMNVTRMRSDQIAIRKSNVFSAFSFLNDRIHRGQSGETEQAVVISTSIIIIEAPGSCWQTSLAAEWNHFNINDIFSPTGSSERNHIKWPPEFRSTFRPDHSLEGSKVYFESPTHLN